MFAHIKELYFNNIRIVVVIREIVVFSLFAYFYIFRKRKVYYEQFWKGFFLILIAVTLPFLQILFSFFPMERYKVYLMTSPFLIIGLILIIKGEIIKKKLKKEKINI
jgi:lipopolysaccharide export LptBFGC system permease protein LptF